MDVFQLNFTHKNEAMGKNAVGQILVVLGTC